MATGELSSAREHRKRAELGRILVREEVQARIKKITGILKKDASHRTPEELLLLEHSPDVVLEVEKRMKKRLTLKDRTKETEDPPDIIDEKCKRLADAIKRANSLVVYTGAGISTAASIPDYRGPNGVWTLLQQGKAIDDHELSEAEPTKTHMAIAELYSKGLLSHVVSQNCDGLHMRSGLPRKALSEVHGNMYIEVCVKCKPVKEYTRLFDVTERTSLHKHKTGRKCYKCGYELIDTIVHFGEKGILRSPLNWSGAVKAATKCEMILCLGSSLKVLRKYTCLWEMDRPVKDRPYLSIVNLQWTPKDHVATLKINGRCDEVIEKVMEYLDIPVPPYRRDKDPIFRIAHPILPEEEDTVTRKPLKTYEPEIPVTDSSKSKVKLEADVFLKTSPVQTEHSYARHNAKNKYHNCTTQVPDTKLDNVSISDNKDANCHSCSSGNIDSSDLKKGPNEQNSEQNPMKVYVECTNELLEKQPDSEEHGTESKPENEKGETRNDPESRTESEPADGVKAEAREDVLKIKPEAEDDSNSLDSDNDCSEQPPQKRRTAPGWFGKGYRKCRRKRRRL